MSYGLIAKKIGMTSLFEESGRVLPVTVLQAKENCVIQVKTQAKDGYDAVQLGVNPVREKILTKAEKGRQKGNKKPFKTLSEFKGFENLEVGQKVGVNIFKVGASVVIRGFSKGKGFQGVMKRHGFRGGRASHGSHFHRAPGSMGACAYPSRVFKGKKLPGHMGAKKTAIRNLKVSAIDVENSLLFIKGAVPGYRNSTVTVEIMKK